MDRHEKLYHFDRRVRHDYISRDEHNLVRFFYGGIGILSESQLFFKKE
jgi:hypothetical protein